MAFTTASLSVQFSFNKSCSTSRYLCVQLHKHGHNYRWHLIILHSLSCFSLCHSTQVMPLLGCLCLTSVMPSWEVGSWASLLPWPTLESSSFCKCATFWASGYRLSGLDCEWNLDAVYVWELENIWFLVYCQTPEQCLTIAFCMYYKIWYISYSRAEVFKWTGFALQGLGMVLRYC